MRGLFVAGTDTGVGKTFVARALCRVLRERGEAVVGLKPFETGCQPRARDAEALEREAQSGLPLALRCFVRYHAPLAPAVAAETEGSRGGLAEVLAAIEFASHGRVVVIESAGGLKVPIDPQHSNLDLARALGLPVVLVGRNALGTLNHVALSAEALRAVGLEVALLVLSRGHALADASQASNLRWAQRLTSIKNALALPRTTVPAAARLLAPLVAL